MLIKNIFDVTEHMVMKLIAKQASLSVYSATLYMQDYGNDDVTVFPLTGAEINAEFLPEHTVSWRFRENSELNYWFRATDIHDHIAVLAVSLLRSEQVFRFEEYLERATSGDYVRDRSSTRQTIKLNWQRRAG